MHLDVRSSDPYGLSELATDIKIVVHVEPIVAPFGYYWVPDIQNVGCGVVSEQVSFHVFLETINVSACSVTWTAGVER